MELLLAMAARWMTAIGRPVDTFVVNRGSLWSIIFLLYRSFY